METKNFIPSNKALLISVVLGIAAGLANINYFDIIASGVSNVFMNILALISLPIIFLSIVSTISSIDNIDEVKVLGRKVIKYTLLTTTTICTMALVIFTIINPAGRTFNFVSDIKHGEKVSSCLTFLSKIIPSNMIKAFSNNSNVMSVIFIAIILSLSIVHLPKKNQQVLNDLFSSLFAAILKITTFIVYVMPIGIWAFVTIFVRDLKNNTTSTSSLKELALYTSCVLLTEFIQATVFLPLLLKIKGLSPIKNFKNAYPALTLGAASRSSSGTLPVTIKCAEKMGISSKVANFSLPICATINMDGCAAFMVTTIIYVTTTNGFVFSIFDMILWIGIATLGSIGNAAVPMSCYFMTSAFLASMGVPLHILGIIFPIYSVLDMAATILNIWSDLSIASIIDKELQNSNDSSQL